MTFAKKRNTIACAVILLTTFSACTKVWDDHDKVTDSNLKNNLYQAISNTSNLSKFSELLVKSGYDKVISASKTYTVWAPTNQALQSLDPAIVADTVKLKLFVGNHISNQSYIEGSSAGNQRVQMLNGKYNNFTGTTFDSANIVTPNQYAGNGLFHIIDKFIPRYDNCWEFMKNNTGYPLMKAFLSSLDTLILDSSRAIQTGVDPLTGRPVYQPGTGYVSHNLFLDQVMNVSDEANQYTFVLLADNAYTTELNKLTPWFKTSTTDSTAKLGAFWLVKDLAFKGLYTPAQLPDTLVSQYGVKTPVKSGVVASYKTSNGIVYVVSQLNFAKESKFPSIVIEGENPTKFQTDRSSNTFYRVRYNPVTGKNFNDLLVTNYNIPNYFIGYLRKGINSMRYNAYWVSLNDLQTTPLWQQRFGYGTVRHDSTFITTYPAVTIAYNNFNEVYLGQVAFSYYADQYFFAVGPTTASSAGNVDAVSLDYIRLEPAF